MINWVKTPALRATGSINQFTALLFGSVLVYKSNLLIQLADHGTLRTCPLLPHLLLHLEMRKIRVDVFNGFLFFFLFLLLGIK